ncbi:MAG: Uma2 family endonuclease [Clostridiales Family XIII bacterium]|jgi:Uma2 family endonuclease|nr:Uma2 family endonuclease [Clostridiales Family XIII bacterium]
MEAILRYHEHFTYADYVEWDTDERYELIDGVPYPMFPAPGVRHQGVDGVPYLMSPAPSVRHQEIVRKLITEFSLFLKGKPCQAFVSPIDVRLNADAEDDTVLQPDVIVVCDKGKIGDKSINGAPDLVVEVLSPSSERYDLGIKLDKYLSSGVRECWIVNPEAQTVRTYDSVDDKMGKVYREPDAIGSDILPGLAIPLAEIFADI